MTAAANGRDRLSCARATRNSPFAAPQDCLARGFDRTGFFEVDTGEQRTWTVQLTETGEQTPRSPIQPGSPMITTPPAGRQQPSPAPGTPAR